MSPWHGMHGAALPMWGNTAPFSCPVDRGLGAGGSFIITPVLAVGRPCECGNTL